MSIGAILAGLTVSSTAFAGWGAIACDVHGSGACGVAYGWDSYADAVNAAIVYCNTGGYVCYL